MKVGIVIDSWKLPVFMRHLKNFTHKKSPGISENTLTLTVITEDKDELQKLVIAANEEAARIKNLKL